MPNVIFVREILKATAPQTFVVKPWIRRLRTDTKLNYETSLINARESV